LPVPATFENITGGGGKYPSRLSVASFVFNERLFSTSLFAESGLLMADRFILHQYKRRHNVLCCSAPLPLGMSLSSLAKGYQLTTNDFCQSPTANIHVFTFNF
jgi:hypothetical protein